MWYSLFIMLALSLSPKAQLQTVDVNEAIRGYWIGEMPSGEGSQFNSFTLELILTVNDGVVSGYSYTSVDDIFATMTIEGQLTNDLLFNARDVAMIEDKVNSGMEWCMKNYILILKKEDNTWKLEGHWNGKTSFSTCTPGKVYLRKIDQRP